MSRSPLINKLKEGSRCLKLDSHVSKLDSFEFRISRKVFVCLLLSAEIFCLRSTNTCLMFSFQKRKISMELCCSFIGGKQRGYCHKNHNF